MERERELGQAREPGQEPGRGQELEQAPEREQEQAREPEQEPEPEPGRGQELEPELEPGQELARELGLSEDDAIIKRASALWWEWESQKTEEPERTYIGKFKCYAYCPCTACCGKYASGITATGTKAAEGRTIAVDPKVIPLGSKVKINGHEYIAEDTGGGIKGNKLDIFFDSHREALNFGVRWYDVYVVG